MSEVVGGYANVVARALGGDGDPRVAALLDAAASLDAALDAAAGAVAPDPAELDAALAVWRSATDGLADRLARYLLAQIPIPAVPAMAPTWAGPEGARIDARLGPLTVEMEAPALVIADPRSGNAPAIVIGPLPPNALRAHLDAGPISGAGGLTVLADGVNGALSLNLGVMQVAALASLRRAGTEPSFAAVMAAGFSPGIQLSFGFQISRIGGVIGINRSLDQPALAAKLRDGSAGEALFPLDVGSSAGRALQALEAILPPHRGSSVAGPTLRLSWLEVAGQGFCSLDLGVIVELPGPQRIVVVGVARAGIPPVLKLRIDVLGVLDFQRRLVAIDASLVDSGLLGIFSIYGDVAFRMSWGSPAYTVVSVGGFYPGFRPEPAEIPPMRRVGFHLDVPIPGIDLRAEGYFAVTSNTIQLGGHYEAAIEAAGCGAHGFLTLDAIVQFSPFHVHADVSAGFEVEVFGLTFGGISLEGTIDGPGPVTIHGRLTVETFLKDFHFDETFTFGSAGAQPAIPGARAAQVLRDEATGPQTLTAVGGSDPSVVLAPLPVPPDLALVLPRGGVAWRQKRVPLTIPIDRLDGAPLGSVQRVKASVPNQTAEVDDLFAPGSFITLSNAEALNRPPFDNLPAGVVSAGGADLHPQPKSQTEKHLEYRKVRGEAWGDLGSATSVARELPGSLLAMMAARDATPVVATTKALVTVTAESWVSTGDGNVHPSATAAHQAAKYSGRAGAHAIATADLMAAVSLGGL